MEAVRLHCLMLRQNHTAPKGQHRALEIPVAQTALEDFRGHCWNCHMAPEVLRDSTGRQVPGELREKLCQLIPVLQEAAGPLVQVVLQLSCRMEQVEMVHLVLVATYQEAALHHMEKRVLAALQDQMRARAEPQGAELHHRVQKALAAIHLVAAVLVGCQGH